MTEVPQGYVQGHEQLQDYARATRNSADMGYTGVDERRDSTQTAGISSETLEGSANEGLIKCDNADGC